MNKMLSTRQLILEALSGNSACGGDKEEYGVELDEKLGVCLDTCHVFDAGYDIVNDLDGVLERFDNLIGLDRLKAIHLNDSLNSCGSHKDRHARIGEGQIGLDAIVRIINHDALKHLPFLLETPIHPTSDLLSFFFVLICFPILIAFAFKPTIKVLFCFSSSSIHTFLKKISNQIRHNARLMTSKT